MEIDINISNYETYLLSAVDGELNEDETAALEEFLSRHPHLRQELADLQATKLTPDLSLSFGSRMQLYRSAFGEPASENYQEALLDYVDNELKGTEKDALEQLLLQHPGIRQELAQLQAARLVPDLSLQYPDKASLYRHRRREIRPIWWWSAAAALVAGVMVIMLPPALEHHSGTATLVKTNHASNSAQQHVTEQALAHTNGQHAQIDTIQQSIAQHNGAPYNAEPGNAITHAATSTSREAAQSRAVAKNNSAGDKQTSPDDNTQEQSLAARNKANAIAALNNVPQPESTTNELVGQSQPTQQEEQSIADKATVLAKASEEKISNMTIPAARPAAAQAVKGELVVSVSMNGDSKLLNGVANVARFFAKKKKSN